MKCIIRKDLQSQGLAVPLHKTDSEVFYIKGGAKRTYRWLGDIDSFQVKYRNNWYNAYSIDYDFI